MKMIQNMHRIVFCLLGLLIVTAVKAQDQIDRLVENYSNAGSSTYIAAVDRDPNTGRVRKVVRTLSVHGSGYYSLRDAFRAVKKVDNYHHTIDSARIERFVFTVKKPKMTRVYTFKGQPTTCDVTIIVRYHSGKVRVDSLSINR